MDFFAAQDRARRRTWWLLFLAALALTVIIILTYFLMVGCWWLFQADKDGRAVLGLVEEAAHVRAPQFAIWHPPFFWFTAVLTTLLIAGGSMLRIVELGKDGGSFVAHRVGARLVRHDTVDLMERRLVNIVEELSIASGVRVPELFILEEPGINSFCAGHNVDSAVLVITRGAVDVLNRDELQAILAHEFSHILNSDMIINTRMVGVLHGLMMFTVAGKSLLHARGWFVIVGAGFLALGYTGNLLGRAIQALVCRQREWLADAHALQFTRNPVALASALKKIGGYTHGSTVQRTFAIESAHMFFANAIDTHWCFRTHPPLGDRIRKFDRVFDGKFPVIMTEKRREAVALLHEGLRAHKTLATDKTRDGQTPRTSPVVVSMAADALMRDNHGISWATPLRWPEPARPEAVVARISAGIGNPLFAAAILDAIEPRFRETALDSQKARIMVLGLLCDFDDAVLRKRQTDIIARAMPSIDSGELENIIAEMSHLPRALRLPLADIALPALKAMRPDAIDVFVRTANDLIAADGSVNLYEYALRHIIVRHLRPRPAAAHVELRVNNVSGSVAILLSAMAHAGSDGDEAAEIAFEAGIRRFQLAARKLMVFSPRKNLERDSVTMAMAHVERVAPLIKRDVLNALACAASHDGVVNSSEQEVLRAVAAALNCPAPAAG